MDRVRRKQRYTVTEKQTQEHDNSPSDVSERHPRSICLGEAQERLRAARQNLAAF
jgi:hypothetical protein